MEHYILDDLYVVVMFCNLIIVLSPFARVLVSVPGAILRVQRASHHLVSEQVAPSFRPAPPGLRPVSETPPWGFPGPPRAVSDMRTQEGKRGSRRAAELAPDDQLARR